jgi:hypothetical protein
MQDHRGGTRQNCRLILRELSQVHNASRPTHSIRKTALSFLRAVTVIHVSLGPINPLGFGHACVPDVIVV